MADWLAEIALSSQVSAPAPGSSKFIAGVLLDLNQILVEPVSQFASLITDGVDELAGFLHKVNQGRTIPSALESLLNGVPLSPHPLTRSVSPMPQTTLALRHLVLPAAPPEFNPQQPSPTRVEKVLLTQSTPASRYQNLLAGPQRVHPLPNSPTKSQAKPLPLRQVHDAKSLGAPQLLPSRQLLPRDPVSPSRSNNAGNADDSFEAVLGAARQSLAEKRRMQRLPTSPMRMQFKSKASTQTPPNLDLDQLSPIRLPKTLLGFNSTNSLARKPLSAASPIRQVKTSRIISHTPSSIAKSPESRPPPQSFRDTLASGQLQSTQFELNQPPSRKPLEIQDAPLVKADEQTNVALKEARDQTRPVAVPSITTTPAKPLPKSDDATIISPVDTTKIRAEFRAQSRDLAAMLLKLPSVKASTTVPTTTIPSKEQNTASVPPRKVPSLVSFSSSPKVHRVTKPRTNESRNRLLTATLNSSPNRLPRDWRTPRHDSVRVPNIPKILTTPKLTKLPLLNPRTASSKKPRNQGNAVPLPMEARGIARNKRKEELPVPPAKRSAVSSSNTNGSGAATTTVAPSTANGAGTTFTIKTPSRSNGAGTAFGTLASAPTNGHRSLSQQGVSRGVSDTKKSSGAFVPIWRQLKDKTLGAPTVSLPTAGTVGTPDTLPHISSSPEQGGDKASHNNHRIYEKWAASPELRRRVKNNRNKDPTQFFIPPQHYDWRAVFDNSLSKWRARVSPYSSPLKRDVEREVKSYAEQMGYR